MFGQHKRGTKEPLLPLAVSPPLARNGSTAPLSSLTHSLAAMGMRRGVTSPGADQRRSHATSRTRGPATIAPGQPLPPQRQRDKFVPLPDEEEDEDALAVAASAEMPLIEDQQPSRPPSFEQPTLSTIFPVPSLFQDLAPTALADGGGHRGRITLYCIAESLDRKKLEEILKDSYPPECIKSFPDAFWLEYQKGDATRPSADVFFFDYGVVAIWGLSKSQETLLVKTLANPCAVHPLPATEIEIGDYTFNYTRVEKQHIQNDTVTLGIKSSRDVRVKLAISYALSQSTKLAIFEERVIHMVLETKNLPEALAESGKVEISSKEIAKLIGKLFILKSAVNLLSSVMDTPDFFWRAPDSFQALYERVCEYLELETRTDVLNSRFAVMQEMLDMIRDHQNNHHNSRLEWIVIWLIVVEVAVGLLELLGLFGMYGKETHG